MGAHLKGTLSVRSNLSAWHILAAGQFAREAGAIEELNKGKPFGDFYQDIASNVMAAVFFSVAALEAAINELFTDADKTIPEHPTELTDEFWKLFEQKPSILPKYEWALLLKGKEPLDRGAPPYQNADNLISLRNELVHYKPEWSYEDRKHKKLESRLIGKFDLSPFLAEGDSFFPKRCMCYSCAIWSVKTALNFMAAFSERAELRDPFLPYHNRVTAVLRP